MATYTTFSLDKDNDLFLDKYGNLSMSVDNFAISEVSKSSVRTILGEIETADDFGIPYFSTIFSDYNLADIWESYAKDTILSIDGVEGVDEFEYEIKENTLKYTARISTIFGNLTINE